MGQRPRSTSVAQPGCAHGRFARSGMKKAGSPSGPARNSSILTKVTTSCARVSSASSASEMRESCGPGGARNAGPIVSPGGPEHASLLRMGRASTLASTSRPLMKSGLSCSSQRAQFGRRGKGSRAAAFDSTFGSAPLLPLPLVATGSGGGLFQHQALACSRCRQRPLDLIALPELGAKPGRDLGRAPLVLDAVALLVLVREGKPVNAGAGTVDQPLSQRPQPHGAVLRARS